MFRCDSCRVVAGVFWRINTSLTIRVVFFFDVLEDVSFPFLNGINLVLPKNNVDLSSWLHYCSILFDKFCFVASYDLLGWVRLNTLAFIVIGCSGTAFVRESRDVMESVGTVTGAKAFSSLSVVCELLVSWLMTMSFVGEFQFILNLDIFTGDFCSWSLVI